MSSDVGKYVLVTTDKRGVFFGKLKEERENGGTVVLEECQNCIYWAAVLHGFLGLAERGPNEQCRIGPAAKQTTLRGVTSITLCTDEAVAEWKKEHWS